MPSLTQRCEGSDGPTVEFIICCAATGNAGQARVRSRVIPSGSMIRHRHRDARPGPRQRYGSWARADSLSAKLKTQDRNSYYSVSRKRPDTVGEFDIAASATAKGPACGAGPQGATCPSQSVAATLAILEANSPILSDRFPDSSTIDRGSLERRPQRYCPLTKS